MEMDSSISEEPDQTVDVGGTTEGTDNESADMKLAGGDSVSNQATEEPFEAEEGDALVIDGKTFVYPDGTPTTPPTKPRQSLSLAKTSGQSSKGLKVQKKARKMFIGYGPLESQPMKFPDHSADWMVLLGKESLGTLGPFIGPTLGVRRGELLLHMWTDFGEISRRSIISCSYSIFKSNFKLIEMKKKIDDPKAIVTFETFCYNLNAVLGIPQRKIMQINTNLHYRIIWTLYTLFNNSMNRKMPNYGDAADIVIHGPTKTHKFAKSQMNSKTCGIVESRDHIKKVLGLLNPNVERHLSDSSPIRKFVLAYGRFLQLQCEEDSSILQENRLNACIKQMYDTVSATLLDQRTPWPFMVEAIINPTAVENIMVNFRPKTAVPSHSGDRFKTFQRPPLQPRPQTVTMGMEQKSTSVTSVDAGAEPLTTISQHGQDNQTKDKVIRKKISLQFSRYAFIRGLLDELNFIEVQDDGWHILWSDVPINVEHLSCVAQWQDPHYILCQRRAPVYKINHFPGMDSIARKDTLSKNMRRMKQDFGEDFDFAPLTWRVPEEFSALMSYSNRHKDAVYICKPNNNCQGRGISIVTKLTKIVPYTSATYQTYIQRPFLIDGFKFDLRVFVLVTSVEPLIIYVFPEGLARFATLKYRSPNDENAGERMMHLTNTSLNKYHALYSPSKNKKKMTDVFQVLENKGVDIAKIQASMDDAIVKTIISGHSDLLKRYHALFPCGSPHGSICFEILGFDIILDENLKAYVLEANRAPSFTSDVNIDDQLKKAVVKEALQKVYFGPMSDAENKSRFYDHEEVGTMMLNLQGVDAGVATRKQFRHECIHGTSWRLVHPLRDTAAYYAKYFPMTSKHEDAMQASLTQLRRSGSVRLMQETKRPIKAPVTHGIKFQRNRRPLYSLKPPAWKTNKGNGRFQHLEVDKGSNETVRHMTPKSEEIMQSEALQNRPPIWRRPAFPEKLKESSNPKAKKEKNAGHKPQSVEQTNEPCVVDMPDELFSETMAKKLLAQNPELTKEIGRIRRKSAKPKSPPTKPPTARERMELFCKTQLERLWTTSPYSPFYVHSASPWRAATAPPAAMSRGYIANVTVKTVKKTSVKALEMKLLARSQRPATKKL